VLNERESKILGMLADDSTLSVAKVSELLKVSSVTVRSDLNSLAEKGYVVRTHGGAVPSFHSSILRRQKLKNSEKCRIAKAAASLLKDGDTVMIEAGTTTALIVKYLMGRHDIHIVTNSTLVFPYARMNPSIRVTLVGGEFRPSTESVVGPISLRDLEQFYVDIAFIGTDGFSLERGLTSHLVEGAEVVKKMASQATRTILVGDSSKHGQSGFVRILPLTSVDTIITDTGLKKSVCSELSDAGIAVKRV